METTLTYYHLGSWTTITDEDGNIEQELSFDAWGNLRDANTWSGICTQVPMFDRGFTGHEHLWDFGLINMNGRMYDPVMSSFLSVDNYVQSPDNSQNFNRYAYCLNNPLKYTDPSGEVFGIDDAIIIAGVAIGAYVGGSIANNTYNPVNWEWGSGKTWGYMIGGGLVGGLSAWAGTAVTASGIPFANTLGIVASSSLNSIGTYVYSGGQTDLSIGFGFASYNITKNEWGYLGKEGNSTLENIGYGLGALANVQDLFAGYSGTNIQVKSRKDLFGHSELGEYSNNGVYQNGDALVSVGPDQYCTPETMERYRSMIEGVDVNTNLGFEMPFVKATLQGQSFPGKNISMIQLDDPQFVTNLYNVSGKIMRKMTTNLNNGRNLLNIGPLKYGLFNGCVNHTSRALAYSGVLNVNALLPITSPVLLNFELAIRNFGIGISPFFYQP